ncbi:TetR family transcriptional regulator [Amycolatopsis sp. SID8362]|nr:TetR family transcriptional regulator [Amycolatopsis sp. SID8362]NED48845.1 TetR family transcriptional regulator [Amycolatopsis sp. SID8362]
MRAQVSEMALDLFLDRGYEQTTIDDICAVAGISRSTFFRYFPSKEDVFANETSTAVDEIAQALRERPDHEAPWSALRHAMSPLVEYYATKTERAHRLAALAVKTPALATINQEKNARFRALIAPELARRLGTDPDDPTDPRPRALIGSALGCLEAAVAAWIAGDGTQQLGRLLDRAMASISPGSPEQ